MRAAPVLMLAAAVAALVAALAGPAGAAARSYGRACGVVTAAPWHSSGPPYGTRSGNRWAFVARGVACPFAERWSVRLSHDYTSVLKPLPGPSGYICFAPSRLIASCEAGNGRRFFEWIVFTRR